VKRNSALKAINLIAAAMLLNQIVTGLANESIPYETFGLVHGLAGLVFAAAAIAHLIRNWNWVKTSYIRKAK